MSAVQDVALDARLLHLALSTATSVAAFAPWTPARTPLTMLMLVSLLCVLLQSVLLGPVMEDLAHRGVLGGPHGSLVRMLAEVARCLAELRVGPHAVL